MYSSGKININIHREVETILPQKTPTDLPQTINTWYSKIQRTQKK